MNKHASKRNPIGTMLVTKKECKVEFVLVMQIVYMVVGKDLNHEANSSTFQFVPNTNNVAIAILLSVLKFET